MAEPAGDGHHEDMAKDADAFLIDRALPRWDERSSHSRQVAARPEQAWAVLRRMDLGGCLPLRGLLLCRGITARPSLAGFQRFGFVLLDEREHEELLLGLIGRFWTLGGGIVKVSPAEFHTFQEPGHARVAWNFRVLDRPTRIVTETRIQATDDEARAQFRRYWRFIHRFSGWTRVFMLREFDRQLRGLART